MNIGFFLKCILFNLASSSKNVMNEFTILHVYFIKIHEKELWISSPRIHFNIIFCVVIWKQRKLIPILQLVLSRETNPKSNHSKQAPHCRYLFKLYFFWMIYFSDSLVYIILYILAIVTSVNLSYFCKKVSIYIKISPNFSGLW